MLAHGKKLALVIVCIAATHELALGHVAPALDANNRYLKLSPMGEHVRLAYTVYMGELPGAQIRMHMDSNLDGTIDDREARAFADVIATTVARGARITMDGQVHALEWAEVHVGLGTPSVVAGAFTVDLIAWLCGDPARREHVLELVDPYQLPRPGETEVRVQVGPGITVTRASTGPASASPRIELELSWRGGSHPLATAGYVLAYTVDPEVAMAPPDSACTGTGQHGATGRFWGILALLRIPLVITVLAILALVLVLALARTVWRTRIPTHLPDRE